MRAPRPFRLPTLFGAALLVLLCVTLRAHSVVIQQNLFVHPFTGGETTAPLYWIEDGFQPCLTGVATGAATKLPNCFLGLPDPAGQGTLRLTENVTDQVSAIMYERLLPTNQGLRITFTQYQYGGFGLGGPGSPGGGDGLAFFLAPAPPHQSTIGEAGGALGYSSSGGTVPGVPTGWLGVGLDAFGSFSDPNYSGAGCVEPTWGGSKPDAIVVRGPEHLGYCLLSSSAENGGTLPGGVSLRGVDRASSKRSIEIVIDPFIPDPNSPGDMLPGTYTVSIDPAGGTNFVPVTSGLLPNSYFDSGLGAPVPQYPFLLTFGFSASTGSAADIHEISDVAVTTLNGEVPILGLTKTNTLTAPAISGQQFEYIFTPRVDGNVAVKFPVHVRDRVPLGMALVQLPTGVNWTCFDDPTHVAFGCTYDSPTPYAPGTVFPEIRALVELDTNLAPGAVLTNYAFTFSGDSVPAYATSVVTTLANLVVTTAALPDGLAGAAYNTALAAAGGVAPYSWAITSGALPAGLSLGPSGAITGTPTTAGLSGITVEVTDANGTTATQVLSINVLAAGVSITTTSLPGGTVGTAYNAALAATGGVGGFVWTLESGTLPPGLALSAAGAITGTPTTAGLANFIVRVTDSAGAFTPGALSIQVVDAPLVVTTAALPGGTVGSAYNAAVAATGGTGVITFALDSGALPAGLALAANGAITGTPTTAGLANFTVKATDSVGEFATRALSINVVAPAVTITTAALAGGTVGTAYNAAVAATGGTGAITFALDSGALPAGLALAANGAITGTPTTAGLANFSVKATDSVGVFDTKALSINVVAPAVTITTAALAGGTVGAAYNAAVAATGGTGAITFALDSGALPAGLALAANGAITGTPTTAGLANFTVKATDSVGVFDTRALSINVVAPAVTITTAALAGGTVGSAYNAAVAATGGTGAITFALDSGALPAGLALAANGAITGTPTTAGLANFTVKATDSVGVFDTKALSINVVAPAVTITTAALAGGTVGSAYNAAVAATGGTGAITFALDSGALPAGLALAANGAITGTPTTAGLANFTVKATDSVGEFATRALSINVVAPAVTITTAALAGGTVGTAYNAVVAATGGTGAITFTLDSGALPAGLALAANGAITGTPTTAGLATFTVKATDSVGAFATRALSINVVAPAVTITTAALAGGTVGTAYNAAVAATGGTGAVTFALDSGALPAGLALAANGAITGTPTAAGLANFTVRATDSVGEFATRALSINVVPAAVTITTAALAGGTVGTAYNAAVAATGGTGAITFALDTGALPAGLALAANGAITGTPTTAGLANFTVKATDSVGEFATRALSINVVVGALTITTTTLPVATVMTAYNTSLVAAGGTGAYTWSIASAAWPLGLTLSTNGVISGLPYIPGLTTVTVRVVDAAGAFAVQTLSIDVIVTGFVINTPSLPNITVGNNAFWSVTAVGGTPGTIPTWSIISGTFPPGLVLGTGGSILGQATTAGLYTFTLQATDIGGAVATRQLSVNVFAAPVVITTTSLPGGTVGTVYPATTLFAVGGIGGTGGFTWTITAGALPAGLTLAPNGAITGTPTAAGLANFTARATDGAGGFGTKAFSINVTNTAVTITTAALAGGTVGSAYNAALAATGGTGAFTWTLNGGALPAGLALAANGAITGTPSTAGLANFTVRATDAAGAFANKALTINVVATLVIVTAVQPDGVVGTAYHGTSMVATGGTAPYTWTLESGTLPPGVTIGAAGSVTGIPVAPGLFNFTLRVTDSAGAFATRALSINILPGSTGPLRITTMAVPNGNLGVPYNAVLVASGGQWPYTWRVSNGQLPSGLSLSTTGVISGTPTSATQNGRFDVRVTDAAGARATRSLQIQVLRLTITGGTPPAVVWIGLPFNMNLTATGGVLPLTWTAASALPQGLTVQSNPAALTGTPRTGSPTAITIRVADAIGQTDTRTFYLNLNTVIFRVSPVGAFGMVGLPVRHVLQVYSSPTVPGPYTWTLVSGALPPGLSLAPNGTITGTPTAQGSYAPVFRVTTPDGFTDTGSVLFFFLDLSNLG